MYSFIKKWAIKYLKFIKFDNNDCVKKNKKD